MKTSFTSPLLATIIMLLTFSCNKGEIRAQITSHNNNMSINITIDGKTMPIHLIENNAATKELVAALQEKPITYEADDYGGFEKVGALGRSLTTSNEQLTTEPGDVILYSGNQIVLFYGSNSWSYTRLGRIDYPSLSELKAFLKAGQGRVKVTLSVPTTDGIRQTSTATRHTEHAYAINGIALNRESAKGIYIKDGKKCTHRQ